MSCILEREAEGKAGEAMAVTKGLYMHVHTVRLYIHYTKHLLSPAAPLTVTPRATNNRKNKQPKDDNTELGRAVDTSTNRSAPYPLNINTSCQPSSLY